MKKVERQFTLSFHEHGRHYIDKLTIPADVRIGNFSFAESLCGLQHMIQDLGEQEVKLGTKVKVTMQAVPTKCKRGIK